MQIVYATTHVPNSEGRVQKNPRHFLKPVDGATKVYIEGDWPEVKAAYEARGVSVSAIEEMRAMPGTAKPKGEDKLAAPAVADKT